jgi:dephospho-CoA kinase
VAVTAPLDDRVQRLMARDNITQEQAILRINAQKPESWFREMCDYTLENNGTANNFQEKCLAFFSKLSIIKAKA